MASLTGTTENIIKPVVSESGMMVQIVDPPAPVLKDQADVNYVSESPDPMEHCSICQHYLGAGMCELVTPTPLAIVDEGYCDLFSLEQATEMTKPLQEQVDDTKGYVTLAVNYAWDIERVQSAMIQLFGYEDWIWQDSATLHITLGFSDNITDAQLLEVAKAVISSNALMVHIIGMGTFETPNGLAVYLKVEVSPELVALQAAVYGALVAQGVPISPFSNATSWIPHITIGYAPAGTVVPDASLDITVYACEVDLARDDYDNVAEIPLKWGGFPDVGEEGLGPLQEMSEAMWKLGVSRDLDVGADVAWDGAAAKKSIFDAAKFGTDSPDTAMARKGFLVYNASAPNLRSSYKLPIAKYSDGKLMVVPAGIKAAESRLSSTKGLSDSLKTSAQKVLDAYKKKAGIGEMGETAKAVRLTFVSEMRGSYPDIPLPAGVNLAELEEAIGEKPIFVTLPIGQVNATSNNGRTYLATAVEQMVNQVNSDQPYGAWGHLREDEIATKFDPPAVQWLAAMLDNDGIAWGKLVPLNQETRDYYKQAKAINSKVATSLFAFAEMEGNNVVNMSLKSIDIADPARVGVPMASGLPMLTREMGDVIVRARAASPVAPIPEPIEQEVNPMLTQQEIDAIVNENTSLKEANGKLVADNQKLTTEHVGMVKEIGILLSEYVKAEVKTQVSVVESQDLITQLVIATQPQSRDEVKTRVAETLDRDYVKKALKIGVANQMGPAQTTPVIEHGSKPADGKKYFVTEGEAES